MDETDDKKTNNEGSVRIEVKKVKPNKGPPVRKWEKRWVLVPNVFQFGEDVWVQKWVNDTQILESDEKLNS